MPSVSNKQQRYMGMELGKLRAGEKTETGMKESQLREFARKSPRAKARKGRPRY
jgi:hypothetical protein